MDVLRTPEEATADLPGFPYTSATAEVPREPDGDGRGDGATLRMAYLDEGPRDAPVVLALHGEPSWSYLYRGVVAPLVDAGLRVVVPDLVGFGRSDKPTEQSDHTYARHVAWTRALVRDVLGLSDVTLLCQDWGGLVGLRLATEVDGLVGAVVAANTGLPDGEHRMPDVWWRFHDFVQRTPDLPIGVLLQGATVRTLSEEEVAAYDAPFPGPEHKAGPRAMPGLIPQSPDDPAYAAQQRAWAVLREWSAPFVCAFSDSDPITRGAREVFLRHVPGTRGREHPVLAGGGHFLQEDVAPQLAQVVLSARG